VLAFSRSLGFMRRVTRDYDYEKERWEVVPLALEPEPFTVVVITAGELAAMVKEPQLLRKFMAKCTVGQPESCVILFIQDLQVCKILILYSIM
jgi:hypothetical protein